MKIGSAFAGIGGFDLAFERCGAQVAWQIEIDRACNMVLERHWPHVKRYGDIRQVTAHDPNGGTDEVVEPVDVICAGFPCQDLSVAGRRKGLSGERSGLFFEVIRLVKEMRERTNGRSPTFVVLENVPGLLSSNRGRDFAVVLWELAQSGALDIAWAVLDAQWFGVPQRRRRVFIVADFGGERAAEILSVPYGRKGDSPPSRKAEEGLARGVAASLRGSGSERGWHNDAESGLVAGTLGGGSGRRGWADDLDRSGAFIPLFRTLKAGGNDRRDESHGTYVAYALRRGDCIPMTARTLTAPQSPRYDGETDTFVIQDVRGGSRDRTDYGQGTGIRRGGPMYTLSATERHAVAFTQNERGEGRLDGGDGQTTGALSRGGGKPSGKGLPMVAHTLRAEGADASEDGTGRGVPLVASTLPADRRIMSDGNADNLIPFCMAVRRLTPRESERLQGFPDDWTRWGADGREISDSARYRMLGNAVAVPVVEWIARRIMAVSRVLGGTTCTSR